LRRFSGRAGCFRTWKQGPCANCRNPVQLKQASHCIKQLTFKQEIYSSRAKTFVAFETGTLVSGRSCQKRWNPTQHQRLPLVPFFTSIGIVESSEPKRPPQNVVDQRLTLFIGSGQMLIMSPRRRSWGLNWDKFNGSTINENVLLTASTSACCMVTKITVPE